MRKRIFEIVEASKDGDTLSSIYDVGILITVIVSLVPLAFKTTTPAFTMIDKVSVSIFIVDYLLRWITADYKFGTRGLLPFVKYPFTFMALVDLISILPSITVMSSAFKVFRVFRMLKVMRVFRTMRVVRVFKAARYSRSMEIIGNVIQNSKEALAAVGTLAILYVLVSALVVFNIEPDTFGNFFEAIYWATVSLTTVGYGDIYPVTATGKLVAMLSSVFGIAIVALPSGIITAGYMDELTKHGGDENEDGNEEAKCEEKH